MNKPPDLIIPIRMDPDKATAALTKVSAAGKKAGDDVDAGAKKANQGLHGLEGGAESAAKSLLDLSKAQIGIAVLKSAASVVGDEFKRAADYVKSLATDFTELRKTMQELAALRGVSNSNEFVLEEAKQGQKYGLTPEENRRFQSEFMNFAGSQVGTDQKTGGVAKGAKLTEEQGKEFSGRIAAMMKTAGIDPALGAQLGGAMLQNAKGPQDVEKLMRDFAETFALAQKGPVPLGQMLPQLSRIMAHDILPQDAAKMFNVVAPGAPGEEETSAEAGITAVQKMKNENKGEEFGVKRGMSDMEAVRAFSENVAERKRKMVAGGSTDKKAMDDLEAMLAEKDLVADKREVRGLVRGFTVQSVEKEGFKQYDEIHKNVPVNLEQAEIDKYRKSPQGQADTADIDESVARLEKGARYQDIELEFTKARAQVTASGEAEKPSAANTIRGGLSAVNRVDLKEQLVNRQAHINVGRRAVEARIETPYEPRSALGRANIEYQSATSQLQVNEEIMKLLQKIAESNQKIADAAKPDAGKAALLPKQPGEPGKPLSGPPPGGNGARQ